MYRTTLALAGLLALSGCAASRATPSRPPAATRVSACDGRPLAEHAPEPIPLGSEPDWGARVASVELDGLRRVPPRLVRSVIETRVGSPLDEQQLGRDLVALDSLEVFERVSVETEPARSGVRVHFVLTERQKVGRIEYRGLEPLPAGRWVRVAPGELYDVSRVLRAQRDLELRLRDEGNMQAKVETRARSAADGRAEICVRISAGPKLLLESLDFVGNQHASREELGALLNRYEERANAPGAPFRPDLVEIDRLRILQLYYDRGFVDADVGEPEVHIDRSKQRIRVRVPIEEGAIYRLGSVHVEPGSEQARIAPKLRLVSGELFNRAKIAEAVARVREELGARHDAREIDIDAKPDAKLHRVDLTIRLTRPE